MAAREKRWWERVAECSPLRARSAAAARATAPSLKRASNAGRVFKQLRRESGGGGGEGVGEVDVGSRTDVASKRALAQVDRDATSLTVTRRFNFAEGATPSFNFSAAHIPSTRR